MNLKEKIKILKKQNKKIGLIHGVFDVIHYGHIKYFEEEGNAIRLYFEEDGIGTGLVADGRALNHFAIAGDDDIFYEQIWQKTHALFRLYRHTSFCYRLWHHLLFGCYATDFYALWHDASPAFLLWFAIYRRWFAVVFGWFYCRDGFS